MSNQNIQGVIPLNGRGHTAKVKLDFQAGEYRKLSNMRIHDGVLKTRYNIRHYANEGAVCAPVVNASPFVGFINDAVIMVSATEQYRWRSGQNKALMWSPTNLPTDGHANSWHKIVGVFVYNKVYYWLTWRFNYTTTLSSLNLYYINEYTNITGITFAMLTAVTLINSTDNNFVYDNFFIYKERLFITTNQGLYWSKSTDPKVFTVPDGGLVKLRDQNINFAFAHKENIYILCDSSMHAFSYGSNPTLDGYLREITNVMGGDYGTSHQDGAYIVNQDGLYAISPNNITPVKLDFEIGSNTPFSKLASWEDYLVVIKYNVHHFSPTDQTWPSYFKNLGRIRRTPSFGLESVVDSSCWFIDMNTGACHTLDFNDQFTGTGTEVVDRGHIMDAIVNPNKDVNRSSYMSLMTTKCSGVGNDPSYSQAYIMDNAEDNYFIYDKVVNDPADNIVRRMKPNIQIEFSGYTPDGNEYLMKKFRSLELMGNFSFHDFEVLFSYDNRDFDPSKSLELVADLVGIEAAGFKRSPYPARVGLNQRGRAISILLRTKDPLVPLDTVTPYNIFERVEITDMRVLWTYTGRGPTHLTQSPTT